MQKNAVWKEIIAVLATILVPLTIFLVGMSNKQAAFEERLKQLENQMYNNNQKVENNFDKINEKLERILVEMQNKKNRE